MKQVLTLSATTKSVQIQQLLAPFGFWRQHIPHLQILLNVFDAVSSKSAYLKGDSFQKKL